MWYQKLRGKKRGKRKKNEEKVRRADFQTNEEMKKGTPT
jgi:hypothetical protein